MQTQAHSNKAVVIGFRCTEGEMETYKNIANIYFEGNVSRMIREALIQQTTKMLNKAGKPKRKVRQ